ncbi:MAG: acylphosphatase [Proteobacteria bacterium]|nr:acylphosphatase [Pseudomonadota bacterium]
MGITRYHLIIKGKVQGVGYRMSAYDTARNLGLTGWVRNRQDGCVEILAESDKATLERFVAWAKQGPAYADVAEVTTEELSASGEFKSFNIR